MLQTLIGKIALYLYQQLIVNLNNYIQQPYNFRLELLCVVLLEIIQVMNDIQIGQSKIRPQFGLVIYLSSLSAACADVINCFIFLYLNFRIQILISIQHYCCSSICLNAKTILEVIKPIYFYYTTKIYSILNPFCKWGR